MKQVTYPLGLPKDLYDEVKRTAEKTNLSIADPIRQSIKLGLPALQQQLSGLKLKPMTEEECRQAWEVPDPEFDRLANHCANLPAPSPPKDE